MEQFSLGVILGLYFSWLVLGAIVGAVGAEDESAMGPVERAIYMLFLLPWFPLIYLLKFLVWIAMEVCELFTKTKG